MASIKLTAFSDGEFSETLISGRAHTDSRARTKQIAALVGTSTPQVLASPANQLRCRQTSPLHARM